MPHEIDPTTGQAAVFTAGRQLQVNFNNDTNSLTGMRGTLWAALNAATEFADHQRRFEYPV